MKICYFDESADGAGKTLAMAGIIVDTQRMHVTKSLWEEFLKSLSTISGREIKEFHAAEFYRGDGVKIDGAMRAKIITAILEWLNIRRHQVVFSVGCQECFEKLKVTYADFYGERPTLWKFIALHNVLALQKHNKKHQKNKGNTILVFDKKYSEENGFSELIFNPPNWTDEFYEKKKKQISLNQIIDVPYFADSEKVLLIQVADLLAYIIRRQVEIKSGACGPKYAGEDIKIAGWFEQILKLSLPRATRYPAVGRNRCQQFFFDLAPSCIR